MTTRSLTSGEGSLVAAMFGAVLDPRPVRLHQRRWWPLQPKTIVMAPDGHVYFPPGCPSYRADFAAASVHLQAFFLHELTHVWQAQTGTNLVLARGLFARYAYLPLVPGQPFELYGIEQQAEIVRHTWLLRHGIPVPGAPALAVYERLLPFPTAGGRHVAAHAQSVG
jgi:hypothetical protein